MKIKLIQIALCLYVFLITNNLLAQNRFQVGVGLSDDVTSLYQLKRVFVRDSLFFTNGPEGRNHSLSSDPRLSGYVKWTFLDRQHLDFSISVIYSKKYTNVTLWRTSDVSGINGIPVHNDFTVYQVTYVATDDCGKPAHVACETQQRKQYDSSLHGRQLLVFCLPNVVSWPAGVSYVPNPG